MNPAAIVMQSEKLKGPLTEEGKASLFKRVDAIRTSFAAVKKELDALPASRMRALAITDLESSFTRAVFALSEMQNPIEEG